MSLENIQKGGYDHFMLKEIFEQPQAIRDTLRGRLLSNEGVITLSSLREHENKFLKARRIINCCLWNFMACRLGCRVFIRKIYTYPC